MDNKKYSDMLLALICLATILLVALTCWMHYMQDEIDQLYELIK